MGKFSLFVLFTILIFAHFESGQAISCITCSWYSTQQNADDCFFGNKSQLLKTACTNNPNQYCQTTFGIDDGLVTSVKRGCGESYTSSEVTVPTEEKCIRTSLLPQSQYTVESSTCYFFCQTNDECNTIKSTYLKRCPNSCGNGKCDYITGKCVCYNGYSGDNCTTLIKPPTSPSLSCIQCDGESNTNVDCSTFKKGSLCLSSNMKYCAISKTTTYNAGGLQIRDVIVRSCTSAFVSNEECSISYQSVNPGTNYIEHTCFSTCDTNNCNTGIPDGLASSSNARKPLQCVVCNSDAMSSCDTLTTTTVCPSSATHCQSIAKYYTSSKMDLSSNDPNYLLASVVRKCATSALTKECTKRAIGTQNLQEVTCQESCQSDGCNSGWPARPRCSQCSCSTNCDSTPCKNNPPLPTPCPAPYHAFCILQDSNRKKGTIDSVSGYARSMVRDCSYKSISNSCSTEKLDFVTLESCNKTCSSTGCNIGYPSSSSNNRPNIRYAAAAITCFFMLFKF